MRTPTSGITQARGLERRSAVVGLLVLVSATLACTEAEILDDGVLLRPNGDVLAASEEVVLTEDVSGDAMAAGGSVTFDGQVGGSYLGAGGEQTIQGRIDGSVRGAGGSVELEAQVGRNVTLVGGDVTIARESVVEGNAYLAGATVRVLGSVAGDLYAGGAVIDLQGDVDGDVRVEAGTLRIGPDANIGGELRYRLEEDAVPDISAQAQIEGGIQELAPREGDGPGLGFDVLRVLAFLLAGAVLVALFPTTLTEATDEIDDRIPAALGLGLLWLLLVPVGVVVLGATVVGIPLALMVAVLYAVSLYLAPAVTGLWLGGEILRDRASPERGDALLVFVAGGAIVGIALLLPWVGFLARLAATCFGLGAIVLMVRDRGRVPEGG